MFSEKTQIVAPSTSATAINPSDLAARGAAVQASLIQEFDKEDIEQSIHPMVTVAPHLTHSVGVQLVSAGEPSESDAIFHPLIDVHTALPARRIAKYAVPKQGGDVFIRICEGARDIKVIKPEPKTKSEKQVNGEDGDEEGDFDSDSDEEEERREIEWKVLRSIAEIAIRNIKAGSKVEVTVNINSDLSMQVTAREVGAKGGVRLVVNPSQVIENGSA